MKNDNNYSKSISLYNRLNMKHQKQMNLNIKHTAAVTSSSSIMACVSDCCSRRYINVHKRIHSIELIDSVNCYVKSSACSHKIKIRREYYLTRMYIHQSGSEFPFGRNEKMKCSENSLAVLSTPRRSALKRASSGAQN